jgi:hypothetical protein
VRAYYSDCSNNYRALTSAAGYNTVAVDFRNIARRGTVTGNGADAPDDAIACLQQRPHRRLHLAWAAGRPASWPAPARC